MSWVISAEEKRSTGPNASFVTGVRMSALSMRSLSSSLIYLGGYVMQEDKVIEKGFHRKIIIKVAGEIT